MGGYTMPSTPVAPANESDANSDDEDDGDAISPNNDEMSIWHFYLLSLVTKRGSIFGYENSHT